MSQQSIEVEIGWRWLECFYRIAQTMARMSKDPSTQVGAVIVRPDKTIASVGFNGFPRGVPDDTVHLNDRASKYLRIVHAEINAILSAHEPVRGYTLISTHFPCAQCAATIIQAGIVQVRCPQPSDDMLSRWSENYNASRAMLASAGVSVVMDTLPPEVITSKPARLFSASDPDHSGSECGCDRR